MDEDQILDDPVEDFDIGDVRELIQRGPGRQRTPEVAQTVGLRHGSATVVGIDEDAATSMETDQHEVGEADAGRVDPGTARDDQVDRRQDGRRPARRLEHAVRQPRGLDTTRQALAGEVMPVGEHLGEAARGGQTRTPRDQRVEFGDQRVEATTEARRVTLGEPRKTDERLESDLEDLAAARHQARRPEQRLEVSRPGIELERAEQSSGVDAKPGIGRRRSCFEGGSCGIPGGEELRATRSPDPAVLVLQEPDRGGDRGLAHDSRLHLILCALRAARLPCVRPRVCAPRGQAPTLLRHETCAGRVSSGRRSPGHVRRHGAPRPRREGSMASAGQDTRSATGLDGPPAKKSRNLRHPARGGL